MTYLFIDTNVLLHYRRIEEIDWIALSGTGEVTIVLCPTVIRELDRHKIHHPQNKFRKRAQEIITTLHLRLSPSASDVIRDGVKVKFLTDEPSIDFTSNRLRQEIADDWFVASVLEWKQNHANDATTVVTADLGLSIKVKSRGVSVLVPNESDKLADELDAQEKQIKKLQEELSEIKNALPVLKVCFKGNETVARMKIEPPMLLDSSVIEQRLNDVRAKHPLHTIGDDPIGPAQMIVTVREIERLLKKGGKIEQYWPREDILRYNRDVEAFYANYKNYLDSEQEYRNLERRTIQFELLLENIGGSPAEDVDIYFHFPDGFQLFDAEKDSLPEAPEVPVPPRKLGEVRTPDFRGMMSLGDFGVRGPYLPPIPSNVSSLSIKRTNSYDVELHVKRAKHGFEISIAKFVVVFDSYETAGSFQFDYMIFAANLPKPVTDHLAIVLEKT